MDFIDIVLARALTPQGQIDAYAARAQKAVQDANSAVTTINEISDNLDTITTATTANNEASAEALADAQAAAELLADALEDLDGYLSEKLTFQSQNSEDLDKYGVNLLITYPDETQDTIPTAYYYKTTGSAVNGSMTQQAVTNALQSVENRLNTRIDGLTPGGGGSSTIVGTPGSIVIIGNDNHAAASSFTEADLVRLQAAIENYTTDDVAGITVDYANHTVIPNQDSLDFDTIKAFGGRKRCIVNNAGAIVAWYGDNNYIEDGSLGQVMVYQPKFYYSRVPLKRDGQKIINEKISVSDTPKPGFNIHPIFLDGNNNILEYILLPAYEGCAYITANSSYNTTDSQNVNFSTDLLSSIANVKPITGTSQAFTVAVAEQMAERRGTGWQLTDLLFESVQQLLMVIEYASFNLQTAFNAGPTNLNSYSNINGACLTGSTASLGNASGRATSTTQTIGTSTYTHTADGKCSISYRGVENPYGNTWRLVGYAKIMKDTDDQNYLFNHNQKINIPLCKTSDWLSAFGYSTNAAWAFIPFETQGATSAYPIGDYSYGVDIPNANGNNFRIAGYGLGKDFSGPFYFAYDHEYTYASFTSSARIMYKPTYNSATYTANIAAWQQITGGAFNG